MDGKLLAGLAGAAWVSALVTGNAILLRLAYVLAAVLVVAGVVTWTSVRGIQIGRRTLSQRAQVGGWTEEWFRATNGSWLPKLWIEVRDDSDLPGHHAGRVVSGLMPGRGQSWFVR